MRELNTTMVATRILTNRDHPIKHFFMDNKIQGEYAMKAGTPQPIFMKTIEIFGNQEINVRKVETTPAYTRPPWLVDENETIVLTICAIPKGTSMAESRLSSHPLWRTNTKNTIRLDSELSQRTKLSKKRMRSQSSKAIKMAMENTTQTNKPTIIATDSLSLLLTASGNIWTQNPKTRTIRRLIDDSRNYIKLIWIPSHVENGGNEAADQKAKEALNE
jgi:hypothetical protein